MSHLTHEQALYERLVTHKLSSTFMLHGFVSHDGYRLVRSYLSKENPVVGIGLIHDPSKSVAFWSQLQVLPNASVDGLPVINLLTRKSPDYEHRDASKGEKGDMGIAQMLMLQSLITSHVLLSRHGLDWHFWQGMISTAVSFGHAAYTISKGHLVKHDPHNPSGLWELVEDEQGLALVSANPRMHGYPINLDFSAIEDADRAFMDIR
ncbi:hypothetical protein C6383_24800 [Pseudomonas syringae pv. actinidiae]|uniref:hypothetical protein n=1 Tax=Pseudomonas syringae TaxID=317 RepID=UPI000BB578E6|nr:hypothetical protein [Pseudomonas syringae]PBK49102.1 hypothetical protein BUE61_24030 [Pseudomonas syringae pv. actinidiae]PBK49141.1 hypothetical protein BUE60_25135 [Pseudomonas syringae pv. actinidiae]RJX55235.1 hypothetical protein C6383_24800 [Pseudomonas syringae pv. actinidiae]RJX60638.1 hypothetical protein C6379_05885 [Pseudomonas syringae pv. actinidiae]RJY21577.1 hypothetical protein C6381_16540 [Pseudomonas syringae pv. actinidiae]